MGGRVVFCLSLTILTYVAENDHLIIYIYIHVPSRVYHNALLRHCLLGKNPGHCKEIPGTKIRVEPGLSSVLIVYINSTYIYANS